MLYSGADDSTFKAWDVRCAAAVSSTPVSSGDPDHEAGGEPTALFSNRRAHGAGVCCISSHPRREHVLVTGSYDEGARLWDVRMMQRPVETCKVRVDLTQALQVWMCEREGKRAHVRCVRGRDREHINAEDARSKVLPPYVLLWLVWMCGRVVRGGGGRCLSMKGQGPA